MKILMESKNVRGNWGDASMLHSSIRHLKERVSEPSFILLDEGTAEACDTYSNAFLLPISLRQSWRLQRPLWHRLDRFIPGTIDHVSTSWPTAKDWLTRVKMSILEDDGGKRAEFIRRFSAADALVVSGGGFVTDLFDAAERVLNLLMLAHSRDVPVFMFGQGIGPIRSSRLRKKAARALPGVQSIALREKQFSYPLLRGLGVPDRRITVTGDDAVSLAYKKRPKSLGKGIGVNLRIAYYSEISEGVRAHLSNVLSKITSSRNVPLLPVPIAHEGEHSDVKHIRSIIEATGSESERGASLESPEEVIQQVGKCRVVVTGSYHGGVFALSQGVPVIGLAKSKYYYNKFHGLADMFGTGCTVLQTDHRDFERELEGAIRGAWERAPELRPKLLRAAERQIDAANAAYDEMVQFLNSTSSS